MSQSAYDTQASILIATYKRPALLEQTLDSLASMHRLDLLTEVIVIDNADDALTQRVARAAAARLPIRLMVEPARGQNRARNRALPDARGGLVVCTDDDVVVDRAWLLELVEGAKRWPEAAVFGGRVLPGWPAGKGPTFEHPFWAHAYAIADWTAAEGYYSAGRVFGPNMAYRRSVFASGWAFNPELGPNGTDNYVVGGESDLTARLECSGFASVYLPRALVFHQIRAEQLRMRWLYRRAFRKGRADFQRRPPAAGRHVAGVPVTLWYELVRSYAEFVWSRGDRDPAARFDRALAYWHCRGRAYESRLAAIRRRRVAA